MTQIKICGLTHLDDTLFVARQGADFLGFVFYHKSPRNVSPEVVRQLVIDTKSQFPQVICVGLFVNEDIETVCETLDFCNLDLAQLHGDESVGSLLSLGERAFKAIRPKSLADAEFNMALYTARSSPPDLLIDTYDVRVAGCSGRLGDWNLAAHVASKRRILLAGGLMPDNVEEAIRVVQPWGVDVSSGVEAEPGRKSHQAISQFISSVKATENKHKEE